MPELLVAEARTWINVPWVDNGRSRSGVDCVGLIICAARNCGIEVSEHAGLMSTRGMRTIMETAALYCEEVPTKPLKFGTLLLMKLEYAMDARHLAIYAGETIIHCGAQFMAVKEHRFNEDWRRRVKRAFSFKEELLCQVARAAHSVALA